MRSIAPPWVWGSLVVVGLVSVGTSLDASHDTGNTNDKLKLNQKMQLENQRCLLGYIAESSRVTKIRSEAAVKRDKAIDGVLGAVDDVLGGAADLALTPHTDPAKSQARYRELLAGYKSESTAYRASSAKVRSERAKNPLPELPATCAEIASVEP